MTIAEPRELQHARALARRGLAIVPLHPLLDDGSCACRKRHECPTPGKHPRILWKHRPAEPPTTEEIERWWRMWPVSGIGVILGDRLCALDVDQHEGGADGPATLAALEHQHAPLPDTWQASSPSGAGRHVYFRNRGLTSVRPVAPGVQLRAGRHVMVLPPTAGRQWVTAPDAPLAELPLWVARLAQPRRRANGRAAVEVAERLLPDDRHPTYVRVALELARMRLPEPVIAELLEVIDRRHGRATQGRQRGTRAHRRIGVQRGARMSVSFKASCCRRPTRRWRSRTRSSTPPTSTLPLPRARFDTGAASGGAGTARVRSNSNTARVRADVYQLHRARRLHRSATTSSRGHRIAARSPTCSKRSPPSSTSPNASGSRHGSTAARPAAIVLRQRAARRQHPRCSSHTPVFFNQVAIPFDYDPDALDPERWRASSTTSGARRASKQALAEWFGYVLSGRTSPAEDLARRRPDARRQGRDRAHPVRHGRARERRRPDAIEPQQRLRPRAAHRQAARRRL